MEKKKYPPYLFDVDFDASALPPEPEVIEEAPPPPTFSSEELQAARDEGFAAGKAEGIAESNDVLERQIGDILASIQNNFMALVSAQTEANSTTERDAVRVASTIAKKLVPEYASQHGITEIEAFTQATLSTLFAEAEVVIRVPEPATDELTTRLEPVAMASGLSGKLKVVPDPTLGPADCKLEWGNGGAERNCEQLLSEIDTIIERFIGHGELPSVTSPVSVDDSEQGETENSDTPNGIQQTEPDSTVLTDPTTIAETPLETPDQNISPELVESVPAEPETEVLPAEEDFAEEMQVVEAEQQEVEAPAMDVPAKEATQVSKNETAPIEVSPAPAALPGAIDATAPEQSN